eukprot:TRINITY_DN2173_c0_g1_i2.p1 TRINITY_DN2173_c0_g1~~TRINITY_DN2173_c0_g1_i2.p1  ORF type:complete len:218 (-),score=30.07 TRINITY_DN2173_c0_g1_i2:354-1007(-)
MSLGALGLSSDTYSSKKKHKKPCTYSKKKLKCKIGKPLIKIPGLGHLPSTIDVPKEWQTPHLVDHIWDCFKSNTENVSYIAAYLEDFGNNQFVSEDDTIDEQVFDDVYAKIDVSDDEEENITVARPSKFNDLDDCFMNVPIKENQRPHIDKPKKRKPQKKLFDFESFSDGMIQVPVRVHHGEPNLQYVEYVYIVPDSYTSKDRLPILVVEQPKKKKR